MNLKDYLKQNNISVMEFSLLVGVTDSRVYEWLKGVPPSRKNCYKISNATKGEVSVFDLWEFPKKKYKRGLYNIIKVVIHILLNSSRGLKNVDKSLSLNYFNRLSCG